MLAVLCLWTFFVGTTRLVVVGSLNPAVPGREINTCERPSGAPTGSHIEGLAESEAEWDRVRTLLPRECALRGSDGADALARTGPHPRRGVRIRGNCGSCFQQRRDPCRVDATVSRRPGRTRDSSQRPPRVGGASARRRRSSRSRRPPAAASAGPNLVLSSSAARDRRPRVSLPMITN